MRVCVLTTSLDAFKGGNHLPLFAALPEVEFTIVTGRMKPRDHLFPSNIRCEVIDTYLGPYYYGCADYLFARAVLRRYPPSHSFWKAFDVIHINQMLGPALLRLKETGIPLFFFIHHPVSADREVAIQESSLVERWVWRAKYVLLLRFQRRLCCEIPHVVTVSRMAAERIATDYGCSASSIHIVPNGVDTDLFAPSDLTRSDFDAIAIGSFVHPRKGFRYLLEAYRALSSKGLQIADVGRRSALQQAELQEIPHVRSFGTVPPQELLSLLQRSSVLLSTSLYEGFGLSLIEAMACGRPAYAFSGGAVGEVLTPIDPELVVPLRNTEELVRRVQAFLHLSPEERARRGQSYREEVLRLYPLEKSVRALRQFYVRLSMPRTEV